MPAIYQFRSRSIISYNKADPHKSKNRVLSYKQRESIANLQKQKTYSGLMTNGSQKRLTHAIESLLQLAQPKWLEHEGREYMFKVNFCTLTLYSFSNKVPGKEAHKECLEPLLLWLRRKYGMTAYIWKAELQSKRKDCHQLHYHLTTDVYINCHDLRDKWNELQEKAGYLDSWFQRHPGTKVDKQTGEVKKKYPNSTDVHATHTKKNLVGYLKKKIFKESDRKHYRILRNKVAGEMAKGVQNQETIEGKIWDCSTNVKAVGLCELEAYWDVTRKLAEAVTTGEVVKKEFDRCTVFEMNRQPPYSYLGFAQKAEYFQHINMMRTYERTVKSADLPLFSSS